MKALFKIIWAIAPFLLFSCTHQEKEIFEDRATQRVDKAIIKDAEILTSATTVG